MLVTVLIVLGVLMAAWITLWAICAIRMLYKVVFKFDDVVSLVERELNKNRR